MSLSFIDSAYPLTAYPQSDGIAFYIGGDTPHVWTNEEVAATGKRYRLPVFVRSDPASAIAVDDVTAAVDRLISLGAPPRYKLLVYGSQSSVFANKAPDDLYWGADWGVGARIVSPDVMTQYVNFTNYDESLAEPLAFWDTTKPAGDQWTIVAWDMETSADPSYIARVYAQLTAASKPLPKPAPPDTGLWGILRTTDPDFVLSPNYREYKVRSADDGKTWLSGGPMADPENLETS